MGELEDLHTLEQEYCPPLETALIHAIYNDYAGQADALGLARPTLDYFKEGAEAEALTGFDPSGSSGGAVEASPGKHSIDNDSNAESWATQTVATDQSALSNDFSALSFNEQSGSSDGSDDGGYYKDLEQNDIPTKELLLAETFPKLSLRTVRYTLQKCGNDYNKATDELLNHVFFDDSRSSPTEEGPIAKGIDAFSEDHSVPQRGKKGKSKKKQKVSLSGSGTEYFVESSPSANRWQNSQSDVDFITSRTSLSAKTVSSVYHTNGASLSATVLAIIRKDIEAHKKDMEPDAAILQDALTLIEGFPSLDLLYALAITRLTSPSISNAQALAKSLIKQPPSDTGGKGGIKLNLQYAPVDLSDPTEVTRLPALAPSARPRDAASTLHARNEAFQKASSAHRRGGSTPVMRQAAAYYAQEGRDLNTILKVMNAAEADAFVTQQSGPTYLDLHGVTVADATRIAKQRTEAWWNGLGEKRIPEWGGGGRRGGEENYRIITGVGRHSEGGRAKIGPAVVKMLVNEGWKVEAEHGELLVTGMARVKRR